MAIKHVNFNGLCITKDFYSEAFSFGKAALKAAGVIQFQAV